ncbi:hypothetical protein [Halorubrum ezzemoulense]|uniref:hypothetical protein n=1 Tax=Halorubrum ezzemoulense TaxID=337243 RepID=UPI00232DB8FD|nr:hypothetical protein [Halorubrum ezzemoulense]MDB2242712.1 hypothetical protein [Halorubrum ezzemoulense]
MDVAKILSMVLAVYAVALLAGFFVIHQILLSMLIATALLLIGAFVYAAWRFLRDSTENQGNQIP